MLVASTRWIYSSTTSKVSKSRLSSGYHTESYFNETQRYVSSCGRLLSGCESVKSDKLYASNIQLKDRQDISFLKRNSQEGKSNRSPVQNSARQATLNLMAWADLWLLFHFLGWGLDPQGSGRNRVSVPLLGWSCLLLEGISFWFWFFFFLY